MIKAFAKYKRVLIKISGESLLGKREYGIEAKATLDAAKEIQKVHKSDFEVAVIIGGGNIFRGLSASENGFDRSSADYIGMLATVMNALAFQNSLIELGVETRLMTALNMQGVAEPYTRARAINHIEKGRLLILGAGTGNPFFSTDTAAALRSLELGCNLILKATKVDGVYDKDPAKFKNAVMYKRVTYQQALIKRLNIMDSTAFALC